MDLNKHFDLDSMLYEDAVWLSGRTVLPKGQLRTDVVTCSACGKEQGVEVRVVEGRRAFYTCKCGSVEAFTPSKSAIND